MQNPLGWSREKEGIRRFFMKPPLSLPEERQLIGNLASGATLRVKTRGADTVYLSQGLCTQDLLAAGSFFPGRPITPLSRQDEYRLCPFMYSEGSQCGPGRSLPGPAIPPILQAPENLPHSISHQTGQPPPSLALGPSLIPGCGSKP